MAQYFEGIGRRKESTARVRVASGSGKFVVNEKDAAAFFTRFGDLQDILRPFGAVGEAAAKYDVTVLVNGGGVAGQADAVRLGVARALQGMNVDWTSALRKKGLLTRDARIKERKKPGLKKARKAPTYTKR
ncbi:MAG: 30S ribosomal protein S9 [Anaerolineales bacterium]|jgi:small subunit ribosomal protein S9|uniref:30S ribosomal protein S9 n=1 Tax=Candidatus Villigracilis vicinus TaxID=3140679 RepID=UPI0031373262|nr:30S ribosomal protein S9 [Anaerolineales bacterium]MBK7450549.1 30S ribosomal protein S9 [Anaerolineales bacterium]MBK9779008.1 30S ribosomal protein S9 [Anaerolineales bacterium]